MRPNAQRNPVLHQSGPTHARTLAMAATHFPPPRWWPQRKRPTLWAPSSERRAPLAARGPAQGPVRRRRLQLAAPLDGRAGGRGGRRGRQRPRAYDPLISLISGGRSNFGLFAQMEAARSGVKHRLPAARALPAGHSLRAGVRQHRNVLGG
eukprot:scaffold57187_cov70-Phaeocystis_antarctica.AAC.3